MLDKPRRLYTGFTDDLVARVIEHKEKPSWLARSPSGADPSPSLPRKLGARGSGWILAGEDNFVKLSYLVGEDE